MVVIVEHGKKPSKELIEGAKRDTAAVAGLLVEDNRRKVNHDDECAVKLTAAAIPAVSRATRTAGVDN